MHSNLIYTVLGWPWLISKEYIDVPLPYAERLGQLGSYVEDILPESAPLNRKQMNFLKGKGYTFVRKLGRGGYGDVYLSREYREDWVEGRKVVIDRQVACKVLLLKRMKEKRQSLERGVDSITREEDIYQDLQHINIVETTAVINIMDTKTIFHGPIFVLYFMELMEGKLTNMFWADLKYSTTWQVDQALKKLLWGKLGPEKFTHYWAKQIDSGLRYQHENRIAHFDIKPANILYSTHREAGELQYTFKLTDFGLAEKFEHWQKTEMTGMLGTPSFMAPEVANWHRGTPPYNAFKPDIYSFGMTLAATVGNSKYDKADVIQELRTLTDAEIQLKYEIDPELKILSCNVFEKVRYYDYL